MSDRHVHARSFGRAASTYHAGRPGYPLEAVRWATPSGRRVVDLGAGTGNLTAALLALGRTPVAVEPDPLMLAWLRTTVAGVAAIAGSAEEIPLAGSSVDGVVAGQAAHWFDMHRAVPEMARVLRPGGSLGLIWNRIDPTSPWVIELVAILREANASRVGHGVDLSALPEGGFQRPVRQSWRFRQRLDRSVLIDLVASRSYVMRLDEKARSELLDSVEHLAPARDRFELPYICEVWRAFRRE
ncbi:MAG TPA: class I SAM-dependent methyltransferase [Acidimicrobiia bacterium]|nr:class I SAM-dependent methyltransferase [Acidimicrobiia bacterium]